MSCKYCNLKHRKDDDIEWIAGEDWESESDDGGYICPNNDGFRMLVYYDARYACTAVNNIKYCPFCGAKLTMPAEPEPLIKDEKIRKAVRAWTDLYGYKFVTHRYYTTRTGHRWSLLARESQEICLPDLDGLDEAKDYTIAELCGEEE